MNAPESARRWNASSTERRIAPRGPDDRRPGAGGWSTPQRAYAAAHRPPKRILRASEGTRGNARRRGAATAADRQAEETVANKHKELTHLRSDVPALARVINELTAENTELREALKIPVANVVPLRPRQP